MTEFLRDFYSGKIYPIVVCALMFISYTTSCEVYINLINMLLLSVGLIVSDSIRPFIAVLPAFLYQFSAKTAMPTPEGLEYLLSGSRLTIYIISFSILILALIIFFIKNRLIDKDALKSLPLLFAAAILSLAFLTNGLFSDSMCLGNLIYGIVQIITFFGIFYLFFLGIKNEDGEELCEYISFVASVISVLIFLNVLVFYISSYDTIFVDGKILPNSLVFGFGIGTTVGQNAAFLIPLCFFGVMKSEKPTFYFIAATLSLCTVFLSASRNAMIVGCAVYIISFILSCFFGQDRVKFAIFTSITIASVLVIGLIFKTEVGIIFDLYFSKGLSDTGRIPLWEEAIESFKQFPIFGRGFYGLYTELYHLEWGFPTMMHSTPLQLLGSMGIFGFAAYLIYRIGTLVPFLARPTLAKTMLGLSVLVLLIGSLIDNFIFYIPHMLFYPIILAAVFKMHCDQKEFKRDYYHYITRW